MRSRSRWVVIGGAAVAALAPLGVVAGSLTDVPVIPGGGIVVGAQEGAGGESESVDPDGGLSNAAAAGEENASHAAEENGAERTEAQQLPVYEATGAANEAEGADAAASGARLTAHQSSPEVAGQKRTEQEVTGQEQTDRQETVHEKAVSPQTPATSSRRTAAPAPKSTTTTSYTDEDDDDDDDEGSHVVSPASPISADSPDEDD